jgi:hypothetical protein
LWYNRKVQAYDFDPDCGTLPLPLQNLKFSSAIRYETRKVQAQSRPRIKGQFAKAATTAGLGGEVRFALTLIGMVW